MKIRKSTFKWLSLMLIFFMAATGFAQGVTFCKEKCCQESAVREKPVVHGPEVLELQLNPKTPLDAFLPSCHLSGTSRLQRATVSEEEPCRDEGTPSCCHLGKAGSSVQALVSQGHSSGIDRLFHVVMAACIQPDAFLNEDRFAVDGWNLQPRAAPVPLYLKNASFIC